MSDITTWIDKAYNQVLPRSPIGEAIFYKLLRWDKLMAFTRNGRFPIDNNLVENLNRTVALGRKSYFFAGSHEADQRAAVIYSILTSCKNWDINPLKYLTDVFTRINDLKVDHIHQLLPKQWEMARGG